MAGDGFFDQLVIINKGFTNAHFIQDHWHLYDSGLKKTFDSSGYDLLKNYLVRMVQSKSSEEFHDIYVVGKILLEGQDQKDGHLISVYDNFENNNKHYAEFKISEIPGNRGRKGSPIAEANNSSVLSYLNDGVKGANRYQEHRMKLAQDLLTCQETHVILTNQRLYNMYQHVHLEQAKLKHQPETYAIMDLRLDASKLNHVAYLRYKSRQA